MDGRGLGGLGSPNVPLKGGNHEKATTIERVALGGRHTGTRSVCRPGGEIKNVALHLVCDLESPSQCLLLFKAAIARHQTSGNQPL